MRLHRPLAMRPVSIRRKSRPGDHPWRARALEIAAGSRDHDRTLNLGGAFERSRADTVEPPPRRGPPFDQINFQPSKVASGEWRDYAIDFGREKAVFSVFRRTSEVPLYRIEKCPRLARRQGAYSVVATMGLILKRGHELRRVLAVLEKGVRLAVV